MKQLTIRGFDSELEQWLRRAARTRGISLNRAALQALRKGASVAEGEQLPGPVGKALDAFIGSWSPSAERKVLHAIEAFEQIDDSLWS